MNLTDKRKITNGIIVISLLVAGWGTYTKQSNFMILGLIVAGLLALFEETIIRWFNE